MLFTMTSTMQWSTYAWMCQPPAAFAGGSGPAFNKETAHLLGISSTPAPRVRAPTGASPHTLNNPHF